MEEQEQNELNEFLFKAARNGDTEKVKDLIDKGADIHAKKDNALFLSAIKGHTEVVRLLLDRGADVNAASVYTLAWAASNGHTEVTKLLLEHGIDNRSRTLGLNWMTWFDKIEESKQIEIAQLLLNNIEHYDSDKDSSEDIFSAAESGHK